MKTEKTTAKKTNEPILSEDAAIAELEAWFDYKKLSPDLRDKSNEISGEDLYKKRLVAAMMYGKLSFNPADGTLKQKLTFPLTKEEGEVYLSELSFKPRLTRLDVNNASKGIKLTDVEGKKAAHIAALTSVGIGVLNKMDELDRGISDIIVEYFLV